MEKSAACPSYFFFSCFTEKYNLGWGSQNAVWLLRGEAKPRGGNKRVTGGDKIRARLVIFLWATGEDTTAD